MVSGVSRTSSIEPSGRKVKRAHRTQLSTGQQSTLTVTRRPFRGRQMNIGATAGATAGRWQMNVGATAGEGEAGAAVRKTHAAFKVACAANHEVRPPQAVAARG